MKVDLVIRGGTIVLPQGRFPGDVYVQDGRIAALGKIEGVSGKREIDAGGLLVLPGAVDGHVHMMDPGHTEREDFTTGTAAAAVGGATTVIEHHRTEPPVLNAKVFAEKRDYCAKKAIVDFAFMGGAVPDNLGELKGMWDMGAVAFKTFTCELHGVTPMYPGMLQELFHTLKAFNGITLIHAEEDTLLKVNEEKLRASGRKDYLVVADWRPPETELLTISNAVALAKGIGARAVFAHVSLCESLRVIQEARRAGAKVYAESCPQYFYLTKEDLARKGPWLKFAPTVRDRENVAQMWQELELGHVDIVSTDHCPYPREEKAAGLDDIWKAPYGIPGIETTVRLMLNGVNQGRVSLERVVQALSETPAKLYGLYPRKGTLLPGADADILLVDISVREVLSNDTVVSKCKWTPYDGMEVQGKVVMTLVRGSVVAENGRPVGEPGYGMFIPRLDAGR